MDFKALLQTAVDMLLEAKKRAMEKEDPPKMPVIRAFIESETARQKEIADNLPDDHNKDWTALNRVFRRVVCSDGRKGM